MNRRSIWRFASLLLVLAGAEPVSIGAQAAPRPLHLSRSSRVPPVITGVVQHVVDGDTFDVTTGAGQVVRVRVEGIDCPERGQPFAREATGLTRSLVFEQRVTVIGDSIDRYGRLVGRASVDEKDVSLSLTEAGLAWHFVHYSIDPSLAAAEQSARQRHVGLWSDPRPVPPWVARRARRGPPERPPSGLVP